MCSSDLYVVVQVRGTARVIDDPQWLLAQINQLTTAQEGGRPEPWAVSDAPQDYVAALIQGIAGLEIPVNRIDGKWKVSQNQPQANRQGVIDGLRESAEDPMTGPMADIVEQSLRGGA